MLDLLLNSIEFVADNQEAFLILAGMAGGAAPVLVKLLKTSIAFNAFIAHKHEENISEEISLQVEKEVNKRLKKLKKKREKLINKKEE